MLDHHWNVPRQGHGHWPRAIEICAGATPASLPTHILLCSALAEPCLAGNHFWLTQLVVFGLLASRGPVLGLKGSRGACQSQKPAVCGLHALAGDTRCTIPNSAMSDVEAFWAGVLRRSCRWGSVLRGGIQIPATRKGPSTGAACCSGHFVTQAGTYQWRIIVFENYE